VRAYDSPAFDHSGDTKDALVNVYVSLCHHAAFHHVYYTAAVEDSVNYRCIVARRAQSQRSHAI
jgi:hypothetical protein